MALTPEGKKHVQAYGEQHPAFHSKEMRAHRAKDKAIHKKIGGVPVKKLEERAKYFSGKKGTERYNNLTAEGRVRSGVHFSYAGQKMVPSNPHLKKGELRYLGHKK